MCLSVCVAMVERGRRSERAIGEYGAQYDGLNEV